MVRSVLAVIAGFAATVVLSAVIDVLVRAAAPGAFGADGRSPGTPMLVVSVAYTMACAAAGGYLAALIARRREVLHALALGTLGAIATIAIIVVAPAGRWTPAQVVSATLVIPATTVGGWVRARRVRGAQTPAR